MLLITHLWLSQIILLSSGMAFLLLIEHICHSHRPNLTRVSINLWVFVLSFLISKNEIILIYFIYVFFSFPFHLLIILEILHLFLLLYIINVFNCSTKRFTIVKQNYKRKILIIIMFSYLAGFFFKLPT